MSNKFNIYDFFLNFEIEEIEEIKNDITLFKDGYKFYYALDTFDIITHFLPYTQENFFKNQNETLLSQKIIAYENFFNSPLSNQVLILDEYKIELLAAKSIIDKQIKNAQNLKNNLSDLFHQISNKSFSKDSEKLRSNFELIITLLILKEKGETIHEDFLFFLKNKLKIFKLESGDDEIDELIERVFLNTRASDFTDIIYDFFVEDKAYYLLSLETDLKRYTYLENTYRDIAVIDRLNLINRNISKEKVNDGKFVFIYLSSAPFKSKKIFSLLKRNDVFKDNYLPTVGKVENFNFHRNIFQTFFFNMLIENSRTDFSEAMKTVEEIEKIVLTIKNGKLNFSEHESPNVIKALQLSLNKYSSNISNHFYLKVYKQYNQDYKGLNNPNKIFAKHFPKAAPDNDSQILEYITKINGFLQKEQVFADAYDLSLNVSMFINTYGITDVYTSDHKNFEIVFGKDIIRNSYHHLPYLFFIDTDTDNSLKNLFQSFLERVSDISSKSDKRSALLLDNVKALIRYLKIQDKNISTIGTQFIVSSYINIITKPSNLNNDENSFYPGNEIEIIDALKRQIKLAEKSSMSPIRVGSGNKLSYGSLNKYDDNIKEINYMLLWLLRRNGEKYDECVELGKSQIEKYPHDPRFKHGLGLCYIAKFYHFLDKREYRYYDKAFKKSVTEEYFINDAIKLLENAALEYIHISSKKINSNEITLIIKNVIAVYNTLADITIRRYALCLDEDASAISKSREFLINLKKYHKEISSSFEDNPIVNNTEAEIEYFEAHQLLTQDIPNPSKALVKIIHSTGRIKISENVKKNGEMHIGFDEIKYKIDALRRQIFQHKGFISFR
jgi:hypothetical protein